MEALPLCQEFSGAINKDSLMSYQRHKPLSVCVCVCVCVCVYGVTSGNRVEVLL